MNIDDKKQKIISRYPNLGEGEASIIAIAMVLKEEGIEYHCVLDDRTARSKAKLLNLNLTGSIGIIKILKESCKWDESKINCVIDKINDSPFRITNKVLGELKNG